MTKIFDEKERILKEFIQICNKHFLWYSLDNKSLLSLVNNLDYWYEIDHHEVFMTFESYEKLRELYPNKILDSLKHSDYYSLQNKFVSDINLINEDCAFININLIIPSSVNKVKKFFRTKNKIKSFSLFYASMNKTNIYKIKNWIRVSKLLNFFAKSINYKDMFEALYDEKYEGFLITSPILNQAFLGKWLTNTNYQLLEFKKDDLVINIIAEYQNYLKNIFGYDWKNIKEIPIAYSYITPNDIVKKIN